MTKAMALGPLILDIEGVSLTSEDKEIICHPLVGGIIFFKRNYESPDQMRSLVNAIRELRSPLLLTVDQEGGRVQRFQQGMTRLPCLRSIGDLIDSQSHSLVQAEDRSKKLAQLMALEIRALDIDLSFAPVLDIDRGISEVIGDRAFHSESKIVSALAKAYVEGMSFIGMQAVGKHFPGHGSVEIDSHFGLPLDNRSWEEIQDDLAPFRYLIANGLPGMMPAHIVFPQIDDLPVGFSKHWLQTILRGECGFQGAIVSDDLSMEGASVIGDYSQRAQAALEAGCDYILLCNHREEAKTVLDNVKEAFDETLQRRRQLLLSTKPSMEWKNVRSSSIWLDSYQTYKEVEILTKTA